RLLYVSFTRARDRLYLSSALKDGIMAPGRGSLGEVFPDSIKTLFAHAASAFPEYQTIAWSGRSGRTYEWRVCPPPTVGGARHPQFHSETFSVQHRSPAASPASQ